MKKHLIPENHCLLPVAAVSFLCGCLLWKFVSCSYWLIPAIALSGAGCVLLYRSGHRIYPCLALCFLFLGLGRSELSHSVPLPAEGSYDITAYVSGKVTNRNGDRLTFVLQGMNLNSEPVSGKAYCSLYPHDSDFSENALFDGALVHLTGRVYHPGEKDGEVHMDFAAWMAQNRYRFGITSYSLEVLNTREGAPVMDWAYRFRSALQQRLQATMGDDSRLLMALLFSERGGLSDEEYQAFQTLGIAHIMSVSGLHISMLSSMVLWLLGKLRVRRQFHVPVLLLLLGTYCVLSGFSAASVRAAVMAICMQCTVLWVRGYSPVSSLSLAMLIVLLLSPAQASAAGFMLSFSAVGSILLLNRPLQTLLRRILPEIRKIPESEKGARMNSFLREALQAFRSAFALSLSAQLGVLLPTALYFHRLPTYGILINLLIVPFVSSILTPLYAVTSLVCVLPGVSLLLGGCASLASRLLLWLVRLLADLPYASIRVAAPCMPLILAVDMTLICLFGKWRAGRIKTLLAAALCLSVGITSQILRNPAEVRYIQTAAGQADAALLLDGGTTVVIDTGSDGGEVLDYLEYEARNIDVLILTHLHKDHIGGIAALADSGIPIREVCLPAGAERQRLDQECISLINRLRESGIQIRELSRGDELHFSRTTLTICWPDTDTVRSGADANDYSLSMLLSLDGHSIFCGGDVTGEYELYGVMPCDVLKVAHHGSSASTGDAFLDAANPALAIITCKSGSRSLPAQDTLKRITSRGIPILRTDEHGDITITVQDGRLNIRPYR